MKGEKRPGNKGKNKDAGSPSGDRGLKRCWKKQKPASPKTKVAKQEQDEKKAERAQTSHFLTYIKYALKNCKCEETQSQAEVINQHYMGLSAENKKRMVQQFFKEGGKKQGLENLYQQTVNVKQSAWGGSWEGYCSADKLLELNSVCLRKMGYDSEFLKP